ncbi:hypothetical protein RchiOBHm_Chr5g0045121 [Rosa chinensis]|uniref:Uncharacterized protein n=1 Tax=Rosa chinensis TaxID=74649 RepID=A0A2P6QDT1_ROSCH|nr:hypothetical protein RchiOBHm_Chr5g0045121 [Rosa chinensis]
MAVKKGVVQNDVSSIYMEIRFICLHSLYTFQFDSRCEHYYYFI